MIICNKDIKAVSKEMPFGVLHLIKLGEEGRGRREIRLPAPEGCELEAGVNAEYTIGTTKSGKARIDHKRDNTIYLLLSSEGGYTRRGDGWIGAWKRNMTTYCLIDKGNGADGLAGRIGSWDVVLLKLDGTIENEWFRIRTSGGGYGTEPTWLSISPKGTFFFVSTKDAQEFADMMEIEFPNLEEDVLQEFNNVTHG